MDQQEGKTLEYALVERAWTNTKVREELERDPESALRSLNVTVPNGVEVVIRTQRPDTLYYMIPPLAVQGEDTSRPINQTDFWRSDASSIPTGSVLNDPTLDIFDDHYRRLRTDPILRRELIENPTEGLKEHFGAVPGNGKCKIEVVVQDPDTIVILLPTPPDDTQTAGIRAMIDAASSRIYDVLFRSGIGGFFIPSTDMTWVLRDFRSKVAGKLPRSD